MTTRSPEDTASLAGTACQYPVANEQPKDLLHRSAIARVAARVRSEMAAVLLGHSPFPMTFDTHGHLFPSAAGDHKNKKFARVELELVA